MESVAQHTSSFMADLAQVGGCQQTQFLGDHKEGGTPQLATHNNRECRCRESIPGHVKVVSTKDIWGQSGSGWASVRLTAGAICKAWSQLHNTPAALWLIWHRCVYDHHLLKGWGGVVCLLCW
jgi:hypothetical protein